MDRFRSGTARDQADDGRGVGLAGEENRARDRRYDGPDGMEGMVDGRDLVPDEVRDG
jgi:hypothetical protein